MTLTGKTQAEIDADTQTANIAIYKSKISELEQRSLRPLMAISAETSVDNDKTLLANYESQIVIYRALIAGTATDDQKTELTTLQTAMKSLIS